MEAVPAQCCLICSCLVLVLLPALIVKQAGLQVLDKRPQDDQEEAKDINLEALRPIENEDSDGPDMDMG